MRLRVSILPVAVAVLSGLHGIERFRDPECLACHVTGWNPRDYVRFEGGFLNAEFAASPSERGLEKLLAGNQCENCHGPGSQHVELIESGGDVAEAAKSVRADPAAGSRVSLLSVSRW
jgi:hypothetical protein